MPFINLEVTMKDGTTFHEPCYWTEDVDHILRSVVLKEGIDLDDIQKWAYKIVSDDPIYT